MILCEPLRCTCILVTRPVTRPVYCDLWDALQPFLVLSGQLYSFPPCCPLKKTIFSLNGLEIFWWLYNRFGICFLCLLYKIPCYIRLGIGLFRPECNMFNLYFSVQIVFFYFYEETQLVWILIAATKSHERYTSIFQICEKAYMQSVCTFVWSYIKYIRVENGK